MLTRNMLYGLEARNRMEHVPQLAGDWHILATFEQLDRAELAERVKHRWVLLRRPNQEPLKIIDRPTQPRFS